MGKTLKIFVTYFEKRTTFKHLRVFFQNLSEKKISICSPPGNRLGLTKRQTFIPGKKELSCLMIVKDKNDFDKILEKRTYLIWTNLGPEMVNVTEFLSKKDFKNLNNTRQTGIEVRSPNQDYMSMAKMKDFLDDSYDNFKITGIPACWKQEEIYLELENDPNFGSIRAYREQAEILNQNAQEMYQSKILNELATKCIYLSFFRFEKCPASSAKFVYIRGIQFTFDRMTTASSLTPNENNIQLDQRACLSKPLPDQSSINDAHLMNFRILGNTQQRQQYHNQVSFHHFNSKNSLINPRLRDWLPKDDIGYISRFLVDHSAHNLQLRRGISRSKKMKWNYDRFEVIGQGRFFE